MLVQLNHSQINEKVRSMGAKDMIKKHRNQEEHRYNLQERSHNRIQDR